MEELTRYETQSDLRVFVGWFSDRTLKSVERGDADRAGKFARGVAHFAGRLLEVSEPEKWATQRLHVLDQKHPPPTTREDAPGEF